HEDDLAAENARRLLGLAPAIRLDALQRHAGLPPKLRRFAALAEGEADDADVVAPFGVERDGAAGAPHEIGAMRAHDQRSLGELSHDVPLLWTEEREKPLQQSAWGWRAPGD